MAAFWDTVGKAANLFQLLGVDAVTLVAIAASLMRFHEMNRECRKLEDRVRMLRLLLHSPGGYWVMQRRGQLLTTALRDAHGLVESYYGSALLARLRRGSGRGTATAMRDLRSSVHSYCGLIVSVNALVLVAEAAEDPLSTVIVW